MKPKKRHFGNRFYSAREMSLIKKEAEAINSMEKRGQKRGQIVRQANRYIQDCGCGCEGCFIHGSYSNDRTVVAP